MDDENQSNGMSGWEGFMLGRLAEQNAASNASFARKVRGYIRGEIPVNINALQNEISRLQNVVATNDIHISKLNTYIDSCELNYARLKDWAIKGERLNAQLQAKLKEHGIE